MPAAARSASGAVISVAAIRTRSAKAALAGRVSACAGACNRIRIPLDQHHPRVWAAGGCTKTGHPDAGAEVGDRAGETRIERHREQHCLKPRPVVSASVLQGFHTAVQE